MTLSYAIALSSITISILALLVAYFSNRGSVRAASRPILIFSMVSTFKWQVQNVGTGPAINVVVADCHPGGRTDSVTDCYPIASGGHLDLAWIRAGWELKAIYTDVFGRAYSTLCAGKNTVFEGDEFPYLIADTDQWVLQLLDTMAEGSNLRAGDLKGKTAEELDIMRNEIYARHGYIFRRKDLRDHFKKQEWYKGTTEDIGEIRKRLSAQEKYEVHLILGYQRRFGLLKDKSLQGPRLVTVPPKPV
jgi:hypothetical protein